MKSQLLKQGLGQTIGQTPANHTIWKIWQNTGIRPQRWKLKYMPNGIYKPNPRGRRQAMAHTNNSLHTLLDRLSPRDLEILTELEKCQVLLTHQIQRLVFTESITEPAANKACRRNLNKLYEYGLVGKLDRRIGGFKAGSSAHIWYLTEPGYRILELDDPDKNHKRKRFVEPATFTLRHKATINECYTQMRIMEQEGKVIIREVAFEPYSWKPYTHNKKETYLKPDIYLDLIKDKYEYFYFIEIDLATESMTDILRQCERYHDYYEYIEKESEGEIFPTILWVVPTKKRKKLFIDTLTLQYEKADHLFVVITPDELEQFITTGIDTAEYI